MPVLVTTALRTAEVEPVGPLKTSRSVALRDRSAATALGLEQLDRRVRPVLGHLGDVQVAGGQVLGHVQRRLHVRGAVEAERLVRQGAVRRGVERHDVAAAAVAQVEELAVQRSAERAALVLDRAVGAGVQTRVVDAGEVVVRVRQGADRVLGVLELVRARRRVAVVEHVLAARRVRVPVVAVLLARRRRSRSPPGCWSRRRPSAGRGRCRPAGSRRSPAGRRRPGRPGRCRRRPSRWSARRGGRCCARPGRRRCACRGRRSSAARRRRTGCTTPRRRSAR